MSLVHSHLSGRNVCCGAPQAFKLEPLVAYNAVKVGEKQLAELGNQLREMVGADPPASVSECTTFVKSRKDEWALSDAEVVKVRIDVYLSSGARAYPKRSHDSLC